VRKYVKGRGAVREWVKLRERNEALDLEVYALAALYILGPAVVKSLPDRAAQLASPVQQAPAPPRPEGVQFPPSVAPSAAARLVDEFMAALVIERLTPELAARRLMGLALDSEVNSRFCARGYH
jgi:hypothetical protein